MDDLINNIIPITWVMLTVGWFAHFNYLMRHIEKLRRKPTSMLWFIRNRPRKFKAMLFTPIPLGLIEYIIVAPTSLDMTTLQDRVIMGTYLVVILMTGAGSNIVVDKIGIKNTIEVIADDGDDFLTRFPTDKEREDITKKPCKEDV